MSPLGCFENKMRLYMNTTNNSVPGIVSKHLAVGSLESGYAHIYIPSARDKIPPNKKNLIINYQANHQYLFNRLYGIYH